MNESVESAINKIKLQEEEKYAKLKEKREWEVIISNLNKKIRDTICSNEKSTIDQKELHKLLINLRSQLQLDKIRHKALSLQISNLRKEYDNLRIKCDKGIDNVWNLRSSFCNSVNQKTDQYDIWALLDKPLNPGPMSVPTKQVESANTVLVDESKLQIAKEKLKKAVAERERLQTEPENGDEFIRIKNALQYSLQSIATITNNK